jgi:hypothetical protein
MMMDGIHFSLRGIVGDIVALEGIPTRGQSIKNVRIFFGTILAFYFSEIILELRVGPHGKVDRIYGLVLGFHMHKED